MLSTRNSTFSPDVQKQTSLDHRTFVTTQASLHGCRGALVRQPRDAGRISV